METLTFGQLAGIALILFVICGYLVILINGWPKFGNRKEK